MRKIDIQGHRGCRGLRPENTIPAFLHALDLGVNTLELDVVVAGSGEVIVSHEPWMSAEICLDPEGKEISPEEERQFNLYHMSYAEIRKWDCGGKQHPLFPDQVLMKGLYKPTLAEVIIATDAHVLAIGVALPWYNIEIKTEPGGNGIWHPEPKEYVASVIAVIENCGITGRCNIQSFDNSILRETRNVRPGIPLSILTETAITEKEIMKELNFIPEIISPDYQCLSIEYVQMVHQWGRKIIPWTVNDPADLMHMLDLHVDGIITDYPNRANQANL